MCWRTVEAYVSASAFDTALARHGFAVERRRDALGGGVAMHAARKR